MKKQRNYILLAFLIPVVITVLTSCKSQKDDPVNREYLHGNKLDLPEEISVIGDSLVKMEAFKRNDTIFIQFANY